MPATMYMGQPLQGQKPKVAIDLFDNSLTSLAPSYLTYKLNEKIMSGLTDKSSTIKVSPDGNTVNVTYDDGTYETLETTTNENGESVYTNKVYSSNGIILKKMVVISKSDGTIRTDVEYDGSVNGIVNFETATWAEIGAMLEKHYSGAINLANFWSVGATRTVSYNDIPNTGVEESHRSGTQKIVILGFNHDTISGGTKSAITFGFLNGLGQAGYIHPTNTNNGGWGSCNRRAWCNGVFFDALDPELKKLIKPVDKYYTGGYKSSTLKTISDKCFLLSESEIFGNEVTNSFPGEGNQYPFFIGEQTTRKKQGDAVTGYDNWLTRSASKSSNTQYVYIESDGDSSVCDANSRYQIIPAFCI